MVCVQKNMLEVLDFDKSNRYLTSFQNRRMRALQGFEVLERREQAKQIVDTQLLAQSDQMTDDSKKIAKTKNGGQRRSGDSSSSSEAIGCINLFPYFAKRNPPTSNFLAVQSNRESPLFKDGLEFSSQSM